MPNDTIQLIALRQLRDNPRNPRSAYDDDSLRSLADSIGQVGLLQPLVVRPRGEDTYELVCGHRRRRAAGLAMLAEVPCIVRELTDIEAQLCALAENGDREDVSPLDESQALADLVEAGLGIEELAARMSRSTRYVRDRLALQALCDTGRELLRSGALPLGGALLVSRADEKLQSEVLAQVDAAKGATVAYIRTHLLHRSRELSRAGWALSERGIGGRPACDGCPYRTGAQVALFDADEGDRCVSAECWTAKVTATTDAWEAAGSELAQWLWNGIKWASSVAGIPVRELVDRPTTHTKTGDAEVSKDAVAEALRDRGLTEEADAIAPPPPTPEEREAQRVEHERVVAERQARWVREDAERKAQHAAEEAPFREAAEAHLAEHGPLAVWAELHALEGAGYWLELDGETVGAKHETEADLLRAVVIEAMMSAPNSAPWRKAVSDAA